jgi:small subunit ribosomal protein S4
MQLREKQKARRIYGVLENQFRRSFEHAERMKGVTGTNLLVLLERRLDNMVYRMGFARSRNEARQLVRHNHFTVNGKKVNVPSYLVREGDEITVKEKSRQVASIMEALNQASRRGFPSWLEVSVDNFRAKVSAYPSRDEIPMDIHEQLIVELYSK